MTAEGGSPSQIRPAAEPVDPAIHGAFIGQMALSSIWLSSPSVENSTGPGNPSEASIDIAASTHRESAEGGFVAFHAYDVKKEVSDSKVAGISVTFGLEFESEQAMSEELFTIFQDVNLPVKTWPYLRSFLADADTPSVQGASRLEREIAGLLSEVVRSWRKGVELPIWRYWR